MTRECAAYPPVRFRGGGVRQLRARGSYLERTSKRLRRRFLKLFLQWGHYQDAVAEPAAKAKAKAAAKPRAKRTLDETQVDEKANFSSTMGKWSTKALKGIIDPRFWFSLKVGAKLSEKLDVVLWSLQKMSRANGDVNSELSSLAMFVFEKAGSINEGIMSLLNPNEWADLKDWARLELKDLLAGPEVGGRIPPPP
eukprot:7300792-Pyramimonas_sp.AAC.1